MGATILLLEDNEHILKINREALSRRGYLTLGAETFSKGEALLEQHSPDIAICDIMLPDGNGIEFYRSLCATRNIPCLFLSSKTRDCIPWTDMDTRYVDYLAKPYRLDTLLEKVETLLSRAAGIADDAEPELKLINENTQEKQATLQSPVESAFDTGKSVQTGHRTSLRILRRFGAVAAALLIVTAVVFAQSRLPLSESQDIPYVEINDPGVPLAQPPFSVTPQVYDDCTHLVLKHIECTQVFARAIRGECGTHVFSGIPDGEYKVFAMLSEDADALNVEIGKLVVTSGSADLLLGRDYEAFWQGLIEIHP